MSVGYTDYILYTLKLSIPEIIIMSALNVNTSKVQKRFECRWILYNIEL